jgi:fatty acid desaturase
MEQELTELYKKTKAEEGPVDMRHMQNIVYFTNCLGALGVATLWFTPNWFTVVCISTYTFARWTIIGHHVCHGGYDKVGKGTKYNRFIFGLGWRRFIDWFDWFLPEAWNIEHNNRHHYNLNELADPDLVEENLTLIRNSNMNIVIKYGITFIIMLSWKYLYYASNTYKELCIHKHEQKTKETVVKGRGVSMIYASLIARKHWYTFFDLCVNVIGPYVLFRFILLPMPLLYINIVYWRNAIVNLVLAEMSTNFHSFVMVVTNHCGNDVYRFNTKCEDKGEFYRRQIMGSVNFTNGNDFVDYIHGYLNYQIEHHLFPDLAAVSYRKIAPQVKEICAKYNIPYLQENVLIRLKKTVDIFVGNTSMLQEQLKEE